MELKPGEVMMWDAGSSTGVSLQPTDKPRCAVCGRFVGYNAKFAFTPDTEFIVEKTEYYCKRHEVTQFVLKYTPPHEYQNFPKKRCTSCNKILPPSTQPKKPSGSSEPQLLCDECFVKTL